MSTTVILWEGTKAETRMSFINEGAAMAFIYSNDYHQDARIVTETPTMAEQIEAVVAAASFGKATAVKRGRNPSLPYVPVIDKTEGERTHTEQLLGLAFATREDAIACAEQTISARRATLHLHLGEPRYRALREQYGLPRDIVILA